MTELDFQDHPLYRALLGAGETWALQVFFVLLLGLVGSVLARWLLNRSLNRLRRNLGKTLGASAAGIVDALTKPIVLLVWVFSLAAAADIVHAETQTTLLRGIGTIREIGVTLAVAWFLFRLTQRLNIGGQQGAGNAATADALSKLLRASIFILTALVILQTLGVSISGILAFGGVGGIAIGFAARDLLANFFGGLMLYLDRPFAVGDWVSSPDREIEGSVEEIGWRQTRIRAFDMRPIYIPNGIFTTIAIVNPSRMTHRQVYETIGIRYRDGDKIAGIVAAVKAMLLAHPEIDQSQGVIVNFNRFAPSSLDFFLHAYTRTTRWARFHEVKQDILLKTNEIIHAQGATIAFPTSTLHLPDSVRVT